MPRCVYINLPSAHARRAAVEASFAAAEPRGWTLHRFEALGPAEVAEVPGELGPGEKGRRLLYVERDLPAIREVADRLAAQFGDEPSAVAGKLFGLIASPQFPMSK